MLDRTEILATRIINFLDVNVRESAVSTPIHRTAGAMLLRQVTTPERITVGLFGFFRNDVTRGLSHYYVEKPVGGKEYRQLWVPTPGNGEKLREIVVTSALPEDRFDAWLGVQGLIKNVVDYDPTDQTNGELYLETIEALDIIGATDTTQKGTSLQI